MGISRMYYLHFCQNDLLILSIMIRYPVIDPDGSVAWSHYN